MVAAKTNSFPRKDSKRGSKKQVAQNVGVSDSRLSKAIVVLEYAEVLSDAVIAGTLSLNEALRRGPKA